MVSRSTSPARKHKKHSSPDRHKSKDDKHRNKKSRGSRSPEAHKGRRHKDRHDASDVDSHSSLSSEDEGDSRCVGVPNEKTCQ